jgi:hypothetical protein
VAILVELASLEHVAVDDGAPTAPGRFFGIGVDVQFQQVLCAFL